PSWSRPGRGGAPGRPGRCGRRCTNLDADTPARSRWAGRTASTGLAALVGGQRPACGTGVRRVGDPWAHHPPPPQPRGVGTLAPRAELPTRGGVALLSGLTPAYVRVRTRTNSGSYEAPREFVRG